MVSIKIRINMARKNKDGQYPLVLQIIRCRKKREIYTPYRLFKEELNVKKEKLRIRKKNEIRLTYIREAYEFVLQQKDVVSKICKRLENEKKNYSVDDVVDAYRVYNDYNNLFVFCEYLTSSLIEEGKVGTSTNYRNAVKAFAQFVADSTFTFDRLTPKLLERYQDYLRKKRNKPNTIWHYMYQLRAIYRKAVSMHVARSHIDPFEELEIKKEVTSKRAIRPDKLQYLACVDLSGEDKAVQFVRDLFMFSFYTRGMSFVDMCYLRKENIKKGILSYRRKKTDQLLEMKIEPALDELIRKYADSSSPYLLPMLRENDSYQAYRLVQRQLNKKILKVGELLEFNFPLTFYVARHTWATLARDEGVPLSVISSCLGHTSERTTMIYLAQINHDILDEANCRVIKCWKKKKEKTLLYDKRAEVIPQFN